MFPNVRFPKASLSVLRVFSQLTGITLDFSELESQSEKTKRRCETSWESWKIVWRRKGAGFDLGNLSVDAEVVDEEGGLGEEERDRIETLFRSRRRRIARRL